MSEKTSPSVLDPEKDAASFDGIHLAPVLGCQYLHLYLVCFVVFLCSVTQGYGSTVLASLYVQHDYRQFFQADAASATSTGLLFAIFGAGQFAAGFFVWLVDWRGRVPAMWLGCLGAAVGAVVCAVTGTRAGLIGGRLLVAFFATIANTAASSYIYEVAPPHIKKSALSLYSALWYFGAMLAGFVAYAARHAYRGTHCSFRVPLWVQLVFPSLVVLVGLALPESPRWLAGVGRFEDARRFLIKYHANGNENDPLIELEMAEMAESFKGIKFGQAANVLDVRPLLRHRAEWYRLALVVAVVLMGELSGSNMLTNYLPSVLGDLGLHSVSTQVLLNAAFCLVALVFAVLGALARNCYTRRTAFVTAGLGSMLAVVFLTVCTAGYNVGACTGWTAGGVAFVFVFAVVFSFAYTPMQSLYPSEVASNLMRDKTKFVVPVVSGLAQFANQFATPTAVSHICYWFYVIYAVLDAAAAVLVYVFFVETRGRTLEELDAVFDEPHPKAASMDEAFLDRFRD